MNISFLDAHLQWIPEYFVASVALRVKVSAHEFLINGAWGSDDQVVRFQRSIQLSNAKNEEGKIPVLVELIAMLNESGSERRTIGSGVCMIFSRNGCDRTKMITLNSSNMEVVMARLLVSISAKSCLVSNSENAENGNSVMLLPASEKVSTSLRTVVPGATHLVEETEKNISLSTSRISCLTLNSCHQKRCDVKSLEKDFTVPNDTDTHVYAAAACEIMRENIPDVSIPVLGICSKQQRVDDLSTLTTKARSKSASLHTSAIPKTSSVQTGDFNYRGLGGTKVNNSNADETALMGLGTYSLDKFDTSSSAIDMTVDGLLQNSAKIRNEGVRMSTDFAGGIEFPAKKIDDAVLRKSFSGFENASRVKNRNISLSQERHKHVDSKSAKNNFLPLERERERESSCVQEDNPIDAASPSWIRYISVGKENVIQRNSIQQHCSFPRNHIDFSSLLKANDACERVRDVMQKKNILLQKVKMNAQSAQRSIAPTATSRGRSPTQSAAVPTADFSSRERGRRSDPRVSTERPLTPTPRGRSIDPPSRNLDLSAGTPRTLGGISDFNRDRRTQQPASIRASVSVQSGDTDIEELVSTLHSSSRRRPLRDNNRDGDSRQDSTTSDVDLILDMQNRLKAAEKRREIILRNAKDKAREAATRATSKSLAIKAAVLQSTKAFDKLRNSFDKQNETLEKVKSELFAKKRNGRARSTDGVPVASSGGGRSPSHSALDRRKRAASTSGPRIATASSLPFSNLRMRSMSVGREARSDQSGQCDRRYQVEDRPLPLPGSSSHTRSIDLYSWSSRGHREPSPSTVADHCPSSSSSCSLLVQGNTNTNRSTGSRAVTRKSAHVNVVDTLQCNVIDAGVVDSTVNRDAKAPHTASPSTTPLDPGLPPKSTVPDMTSYRSQNLLVTLVLDRIEAIQGLMEGAPKDEAQSMFEMIERLASLVLALTAVIKTDSVALEGCVVNTSTPSIVYPPPTLPPAPAPAPAAVTQSDDVKVESNNSLSTHPLQTAPTATGRSSSSYLRAVSTARSDHTEAVLSSSSQSKPQPYLHPIAPFRGGSEDSSSSESTDSDNVDVIFESPFKSIRMSSTSVSSEDSLSDSAVCIDIQGKRDLAESRLSERMLSNRYQRHGSLDRDAAHRGKGYRTSQEQSLHDSSPFTSSTELGTRTGTGTWIGTDTGDGLHSGRVYSQSYASKAKAVPPPSSSSSPSPYSSYLLQDLPLSPYPKPDSDYEPVDGVNLPAADWLFDDGEASSGGISNDLAHVSRAIGNLQMRISSYITPTPGPLDGVAGQGQGSGSGEAQGPDAVPCTVDMRLMDCEVGERKDTVAYYASRGVRTADRFNAPRLFNDFSGIVDPDSDSDSAEDQEIHLTRVGRAGSISTISTYDRENMYAIPRDRIMVRQD